MRREGRDRRDRRKWKRRGKVSFKSLHLPEKNCVSYFNHACSNVENREKGEIPIARL